MSEHDWKPGVVAIRSYTGDSGYEMRSMLVIGCPLANHDAGMHWHHVNGGWDPALPARQNLDYRPLLVIDPEDREQVRSLLETYGRQFTDWTPELDSNVTRLQQALRAMLAPPKPPKPEEPLGLGAVVVDSEGRRWVSVSTRLDVPRWLNQSKPLGSTTQWSRWDALDAVDILSQGVTS